MESMEDIVKKIFFRSIEPGITDDDYNKLIEIIKSVKPYKIDNLSNVDKIVVLNVVINLFKEGGVDMKSLSENEITFTLPGQDPITINIKKIQNMKQPVGFGSRTARFGGGKRTKKNIKLLQNGGEPVTATLVGCLIGVWALNCVVGIYNIHNTSFEKNRAFCKLPFYVAALPFWILNEMYKSVRTTYQSSTFQSNRSNATVVPNNANIEQTNIVDADADAKDISSADPKDISSEGADSNSNVQPSETDLNADSKGSFTNYYLNKKGIIHDAKYFEDKANGKIDPSSEGGKSRSKMRKRKSRRTKK
jgi:hypothetical protein